MFPYLEFLDTPSGRLTIGATARSSQSDAQGIVTGIQETHYDALSSHSVQIDGRQWEPAAQVVLVAPVPADVQLLLDQAQHGVTSGAFEVQVCQEGNRVYFADTAEQVMQLLGIKIGIHPDFAVEETERLKAAAAAGLRRELRFRGCFGISGPLAYVSSYQQRAAPLFAIGQTIYLYDGYTPYTVSERLLVKGDHAHQLPTGKWHYREASDYNGIQHRYPEHVVMAEPLTGPNIPVIPVPVNPS
jgi:hypothetical protein